MASIAISASLQTLSTSNNLVNIRKQPQSIAVRSLGTKQVTHVVNLDVESQINFKTAEQDKSAIQIDRHDEAAENRSKPDSDTEFSNLFMASENFVQPAIPRFDGHYDHWSMLMENFLRSKEYWQVVSEGIAEPVAGIVWTDAQKAELEAQKLKDLKAKNYLFQAIDRSILETILNKDTSKQIWDSMKKKYQGTARAKRVQLQALRAEFENLKMKSGELVSEYFSRIMVIANKMRIHGEKLDDVTIVEKILRSMMVKFNFVVCSIEESKDIDTLSIDELQSSLLVHEQKLSKQDQEEQVLQAETKGVWHDKGGSKGKSKHHKSGENKVADSQGNGKGRDGQNSARPKSKYVDKSKIECFRCHRYGHYRSECRTNLIKDRGERSERSNFAEKEEEISLLMVSHIQEETNENLWYLDTGCSNHICGVKSAFSDLDESFRNTVKFGDNSTVSVMGKGRVSIQTKRNSTLSIPDVLYVPDLKSNLLSVGQLQEKGYEISIKDGVCRIQDDNLGLIAQVRMTANQMFPLYLHKTTHSNFSASVKDEACEDEGDKGQQATLEVSAEIQNIPDIPQRNQVTTGTQLDVAAGSRPQRYRKGSAWMTNYERWKNGTWHLNMFVKNGKIDWDSVIVAEARRRKFLQVHPEASSNEEPVVFRSFIIPWWAWLLRSYLPEAELLNGRAAMVGFFMAYIIDALTGLDVVGQSGNFICKAGLFVVTVTVLNYFGYLSLHVTSSQEKYQDALSISLPWPPWKIQVTRLRLQSLDKSIFIGNQLFGPSLVRNCSESHAMPLEVEEQDREATTSSAKIICNGNLNVLWKENERQVLLALKKDLKDNMNRLSTWGELGDCCNGTGIVCDNITGHVFELDLFNT
ncbi:hypothetical protein FEM48_Zijuj03G0125400 [Ziziphus jujuba var. spinosa]|uniref:CCHC-type domain-containing protein n=1 Tax=Ziziphus jujuba var. spinosa TaxID=714518 RepID=A0A978VQB8_ZIZJJ|nr:hypothetical protein FEM48_Zijuj03G0125400 [Ziziphus jujuba var. spinosa]